jgi:protein-tyrosine phosphatase
MIKKVKVYPRMAVEQYFRMEGKGFPFSRWYLISIYGEDDDELYSTFSKPIFESFGLVDGLSLQFWDITEKDYPRVKERFNDAILFNTDHAKQAFEFIKRIHEGDPEEAVLVVHCAAGISRSGAIGTFANDYYGLSYTQFISDNPRIFANQFVLKLIRQVSGFVPIADHDGVAFDELDGILVPNGFKTEQKFQQEYQNRPLEDEEDHDLRSGSE